MNNGIFKMDTFANERTLNYLPGCDERIELREQLQLMKSRIIEIPVIIGGKEYKTGNTKACIIPHDKNHILAYYHEATEELVNLAIETAMKSKEKWQGMPSEHRIGIFKRLHI